VPRSLSVLLPVYNVQSTIVETVLEILDVVSELTEEFELVIIDDGSEDATTEVIHELTHDYPQVRVVSHRKRLGREAAIRTGFQHSKGEIIFVRDDPACLASDAISRLWHAAQQPVCMSGALAAKPRREKNGRKDQHASRHAGYHMADRPTMERLHGSSQPTRPNYLARGSHTKERK